MSKICKVDGCLNNTGVGELCWKHYTRMRRHGNYNIVLKDWNKRNGLEQKLKKTYGAMIRRCYTSTHPHYKDYGGRGIKVCDRWLGKEGLTNFAIDMGEKPSYEKTKNGRPLYSLDRIDNDGDYCPENCRWATSREQRINSRQAITEISFMGETHLVSEWATITGINESTLRQRIKRFGTFDERIFYRGKFSKK